ncbi:hypothetical protein [Gracilibacillus salinarum]|uniref:Uncharacterized protein n=1 Tax=Gracilibacillus salinarum TaxID=2932255 RepID=A0ABY4GHE2_9BACI|nr:hypothetical protein [Gracilibacillus salinarum]UOQ83753.1 hypothetical protein MUN87_13420 [Gracilibacillus salinarum]
MKKKKKKKNNSVPRRKRTNKQGRLQAAPHWIPKYEGKNLVKGYAKHFGVNKLNAIVELETLGYEIDEKYKDIIKQDEIRKQNVTIERKRRKAEQKQMEEQDFESDETFYYIAGYTPGGAPYGITWEEMEDE